MIEKVKKIFKIPDLRNRILFILAIFTVFRLMANIPMPGFEEGDIHGFFDRFEMFQFANILTGGTLDQFSIVMLGLGPYITAVIVMQLMTLVSSRLEKMQKEEGEAGRKKINQYGRLLTVPFAILQSYGMLALFQREGVIEPLSISELALSIITITAGTVFLMWLGELISEKGIGNGVSLLIFAGIIASLPANVWQMIVDIDISGEQIQMYLLILVIIVLVTASVVFVNEARRNIPVSYARRVRGRRVYGGASTYIPLSLNPAGVIPIIFAISVLALPSMVAGFFVGVEGIVGTVSEAISTFLENPWAQGSLYFLLVVLFTYFYTAVTFDPKNVSKNLQNMGGFVPGIRPGKPTSNFINYILNRVLFLGAVFLGTIAVLPSIIAGATGVETFGFLLGGASLLIMVSVVLQTMKQINSQLQMREYEKI